MKRISILGLVLVAGVAAGCSQSGYRNLDTTIALEEPWVRESSLVRLIAKGDPTAARVRGNMYYWGEHDVERSEEEAAKYWKIAASNGDLQAQENLRRMAAGQPVEGELNPDWARNEAWPWAEQVWDTVDTRLLQMPF